MKKEKKQKTPSQLYRQYKVTSKICFVSEFLSVFAPFLIIGIINHDKYFVQYSGTKMSLACTLAFGVMGIAIYMISKKKWENTYIALIIKWAIFDVIFFLLGEIINDIAVIMFFGWFGLIGAQLLESTSKSFEKKAERIKKAMDRAEEDLTAEAYKEEKKVKVKIIKKEETRNDEQVRDKSVDQVQE